MGDVAVEPAWPFLSRLAADPTLSHAVNHPSHATTDAELYSGSVVRLASLFYDDLAELGRFEPVTPAELPAAARRLLAHNNHMTVTLEAESGCPVVVRALAEWRDEGSYARNSLLSRQSDGVVLQFGIMRIWLADLPANIQEEITVKRVPLGRVLVDHNLLREVELTTLWRITPGPALRRHLPNADGREVYGRSAQILVDERPTVQVLEIAAPLESQPR
jgi:chorismate-pyruvate lyase